MSIFRELIGSVKSSPHLNRKRSLRELNGHLSTLKTPLNNICGLVNINLDELFNKCNVFSSVPMSTCPSIKTVNELNLLNINNHLEYQTNEQFMASSSYHKTSSTHLSPTVPSQLRGGSVDALIVLATSADKKGCFFPNFKCICLILN
jgi:hypothetical protein